MIFTEKFYVSYSDINRSLRLSNSAILRIFENVASMHGASVGDGIKDSSSRWFLTGYKVKVFNRPETEERVTVKTWHRGSRGFFSCREFEVYNEDGSLALIGISNWARVNIETGRSEKIGPDIAEKYGEESEKTNFDSPWIGKIKEPDEFLIEKDYFIDRNFIDANNHMNNVYYLDLANCILPEEVFGSDLDEFEVSYRKAIPYGETVRCCYGETDDSYVVAVKSEDGKETKACIRYAK